MHFLGAYELSNKVESLKPDGQSLQAELQEGAGRDLRSRAEGRWYRPAIRGTIMGYKGRYSMRDRGVGLGFRV